MKAVAPLIAAALLLPAAAQAQSEAPAGLAAAELARSTACVTSLARMADLNRRLDPFVARMERLRALGRAVSLEDASEAAPLSTTDSVEVAVAKWFEADQLLAQQFVANQDPAITAQRKAARDQILEFVRGTMAAVNERAQAEMEGANQIESAVLQCDGAIFVRPAVLEACSGVTSDLCSAAQTAEPGGAYRFVDDAVDLWDVEDYRPWTEPAPLQISQDGALTGGRTLARARKGNIVLTMGLAPMLRERAALDPEQVSEFETNLDSLGFTFEHPDFVMAPAVEFQANVPAPLGGETNYLLHFGDLSGDDIIWSVPVGEPGLIQATFPASAMDLARLQRGDVVSLTAVKVPQAEPPAGETVEAEPVYTVPLLQVNQAQAVGVLLQYMASGQLGRDLARLVPPSGGTGGL